MADSYDLLYREEQEEKCEAALSLLELDVDDRVLDVGCGTGLLIQAIAASIAQAVGIDFSVKMLEHAKRRCEDLFNVSLIRADADHLPMRQDVFDKAFAVTLIQNMPNPGRTIRELVKALVPCSRLVITAPRKAYRVDELKPLVEAHGPVLVEIMESDRLKDLIGLFDVGWGLGHSSKDFYREADLISQEA